MMVLPQTDSSLKDTPSSKSRNHNPPYYEMYYIFLCIVAYVTNNKGNNTKRQFVTPCYRLVASPQKSPMWLPQAQICLKNQREEGTLKNKTLIDAHLFTRSNQTGYTGPTNRPECLTGLIGGHLFKRKIKEVVMLHTMYILFYQPVYGETFTE